MAGGEVMNEDFTAPAVNSEGTAKALDLWGTLVKEGYAAPNSTGSDPTDERFWPRRSFVAPPHPYGEYDRARVVILPVPYDSTTTARAGARDGPNAIIDNSEDMELYDVGLGYEAYLHGIYTSPSVAVTNETPEAMIRRITEAAQLYVNDGKFLATFGGEHTIGVGSFRAHLSRYPNLSVLAIDAHADLRDEYQGPLQPACSLGRM
jgi:agmatinase